MGISMRKLATALLPVLGLVVGFMVPQPAYAAGATGGVPHDGAASGTDVITFVVRNNNPAEHPRVLVDYTGNPTPPTSGHFVTAPWHETVEVPHITDGFAEVLAANAYTHYQHTHIAVQLFVNGTLISSVWAGGSHEGVLATYIAPGSTGFGAPTPILRSPGRPGGARHQSTKTSAAGSFSAHYTADNDNHARRLDLDYCTDQQLVVLNNHAAPWSTTVSLADSSTACVDAANTSSADLTTEVRARLYVDGAVLGGGHSIGQESHVRVEYERTP